MSKRCPYTLLIYQWKAAQLSATRWQFGQTDRDRESERERERGGGGETERKAEREERGRTGQVKRPKGSLTPIALGAQQDAATAAAVVVAIA